MLLVTVLTAQALQLAGIIETPKGLHELTYQQEHEYNFQVAVGEASSREKRETGERSKLIDSFFNIPIQTLQAVNNLVQNSRPAFRSLREYAMKRLLKSKTTTTTTTEPSAESNVVKRSFPVYVRPKEDEDKYKL
ncbi:unnamed protein product [Acanthoscelides obtectus]|uniref:Uncharacterized protein n=1 Tax=Acanthoscelides obtectus TaxID=200917 RepID=A0A9P0Q2N0_ACAOB|nr:unnamed protein product [Acanthoscelides obtectus]CAK1646258.1 hypothetical protein AOBTE_LOCUS14535 [Acanthoscelides obtectus]